MLCCNENASEEKKKTGAKYSQTTCLSNQKVLSQYIGLSTQQQTILEMYEKMKGELDEKEEKFYGCFWKGYQKSEGQCREDRKCFQNTGSVVGDLAHAAGEDGTDLKVLSERGRKYSVQVRTSTVFHSKEEGR